MGKKGILFLTQSAMIAAIYVVLTLVFKPFSFGEVQVRVAEALTILPVFTPAAIPGLFVGCLLGNGIAAAAIPDIIFGSLATLLGAIGTYMLRKQHPIVATLPPIISNVIIVPLILRYAYAVPIAIPILMLFILAGQVVSCTGLGLLLHKALDKNKQFIFKNLTEY
jgi:Predicted membrane protein